MSNDAELENLRDFLLLFETLPLTLTQRIWDNEIP